MPTDISTDIDDDYINTEIWPLRHMQCVTVDVNSVASVRELVYPMARKEDIHMQIKMKLNTDRTVVRPKSYLNVWTNEAGELHNLYWLSMNKNYSLQDPFSVNTITGYNVPQINLIGISAMGEANATNNFGWNLILTQIWNKRDVYYGQQYPRGCMSIPCPSVPVSSVDPTTDAKLELWLEGSIQWTVDEKEWVSDNMWIPKTRDNRMVVTRQTTVESARKGTSRVLNF